MPSLLTRMKQSCFVFGQWVYHLNPVGFATITATASKRGVIHRGCTASGNWDDMLYVKSMRCIVFMTLAILTTMLRTLLNFTLLSNRDVFSSHEWAEDKCLTVA